MMRSSVIRIVEITMKITTEVILMKIIIKNDNSTNTIDVAIRTVNENDVQIASTASHQSDFGISPTQ